MLGIGGLQIPVVHAQDLDGNLSTVQEESGLADADLYTTIGVIIGVFLSILGIIALGIILYAGWLWMTAGGDAKKVDEAKQWMINGVIGLVIILSAYGITSFIINMLSDAGLAGGGSGGTTGGTTILSSEPHSGSLGQGIRDHYPARGANDVARNTRIFVTFRDEMDISSFIVDYDTNGTPDDVSDDTAPATAYLNGDNIQITYETPDGESGSVSNTEVTVGFTGDLKTFTFDPPVLGSATDDWNYTVVLNDDIENVDGETPINSGGYEWTFTTGNSLDLTSPTITSVIPRADNSYDRNITVQVTFSEAVDPTSATGETASGFSNIYIAGLDGITVDGGYEISNQYRTVTFTSTDACGTNSCGETIYCLPASDTITATVVAATPGTSPPQVDEYPYDGVVDVAGNAFDGNGDETYADYDWSFYTTNDVNLSAPEVEAILPDIREEDVSLDQDVVMTFGCTDSNDSSYCDSILMSSTVDADNITITPNPTHELWFNFSSQELTSDDQPITSTEQTPAKTQVTIDHGIFLESTETSTYGYATSIGRGLRNQYQNCYNPGAGPSASGGRCDDDSLPYCCNGIEQTTACSF